MKKIINTMIVKLKAEQVIPKVTPKFGLETLERNPKFPSKTINFNPTVFCFFFPALNYYFFRCFFHFFNILVLK